MKDKLSRYSNFPVEVFGWIYLITMSYVESAPCIEMLQQNREVEICQEQSVEISDSRDLESNHTARGRLVWYKRWVVCYHKNIPDVPLVPSEPRALREASTAKYCWPRNSSRKLYLDHYTTPKQWTFFFTDVANEQGYFQDPGTLKYIRARPNRCSVVMKETSSPTDDSYIFKMEGDVKTPHARVKHVSSGLYFGEGSSQTMVLVSNVANAVLFSH